MLLDDIVGPMSIEEHIGKVKGGYRLYSHKGKNLGTFPNKTGAEKHEREVQYFKHADESVETLNELDLFDKQKTYFKMGNGQWIVANYRNVGSINGPAFDQQFFRSLQWLAPVTSQALGLDAKLANKGPMVTNVYDFTDANSLSHDNVNHDLIDAVQDWVTKNPPANTAPSQQVAQNQQQGVTEQLSDASPITGAITRRILKQRLDLLTQYGPELVGAAIDNVADYVGDVDEIGSSDISAWVQQVERMLKDNPPEAFAEGSVAKKPQPYNDPNWVKNLPKEKLDALAGPRYKKDKKEQGVAEGSEIKIPTEDGITMQDIRLMAGEGKLTKKTVLQAIAVIRKQRRPKDVAESYDNEELANEVYAEFERIYPNLARRANERTVHAAIMDVLNYGGDSNPSALAQDVARAVKRDMQQGVAEDVATTIPELDAKKYLRKYGADHFQTTTDELHFYKNGKPFSVDLVLNPDATRSVTISSLNSARRGLTGQGVAEMDKSQKSPAGWNLDDYDYGKGKWTQGKIVTAKDAIKDMDKELNRAFNNPELKDTPKKTDEDNYYNNRTGFRKPSADVSGEGEPQGMFMVVINGRDWKEFTSNKAFTVAKTVAAKNPTKQVQVRWPTGQLNTIKEGMSQSDISGLMAASRLHKEFVVKTDTKSYRVQAQSANVAKEKVIKKFPGATIVSVKEKNTEATLQENESDAVYGAILRRIMGAHLSLLSNYGPEAVMNATEEVADWVGEVDEIGTSDVSGWVRDVFNKLQAEYPVQESHSDDEYDDEEQDSELYSGCYVQDTLDGDHGEIFRMQGSPEERRVQILDRDGRGWYISPGRLAKVDDNDPAIAKYFAEDSWHAEDNAWHGGGNEAVDAWHGQSSAGPMAETEEPKKETPKTVAKTWDQMTSKEKLSGVKGRTMYNQKTSKYYVVFDVPATGK